MDKLLIQREGNELWQYDFHALTALPSQEEQPLRSLGGMVVGSIRLRALVGDAAGKFLTFHSADGYSTSLSRVSIDDCLIAYRLDLMPLPRKLGGPFRVFIAGANPRSCLKYVDLIDLGEHPRSDLLPSCDHVSAVDYR